MIIWASHQRCSLVLPLGCETFMVECPSLRIVCELYLFMICAFCLHGTSFEKVSCTYRSQQFPFVLASLQTAEGVTNGASSAGGLREPLSARCLRTHCPSSQLLPVIFDSSSRKKQATLLTRSELLICAQNQWVSVINLWATLSSGFWFCSPGLYWRDVSRSDEWWQTWQGFTVLCCYLTSPLLLLFLGSCHCEQILFFYSKWQIKSINSTHLWRGFGRRILFIV